MTKPAVLRLRGRARNNSILSWALGLGEMGERLRLWMIEGGGREVDVESRREHEGAVPERGRGRASAADGRIHGQWRGTGKWEMGGVEALTSGLKGDEKGKMGGRGRKAINQRLFGRQTVTQSARASRTYHFPPVSQTDEVAHSQMLQGNSRRKHPFNTVADRGPLRVAKEKSPHYSALLIRALPAIKCYGSLAHGYRSYESYEWQRSKSGDYEGYRDHGI
ncbi:hypothetical protein C8F04DRAFT_1188125 [Mycena alexandri]|uniref:Uncharacterized protein n=1 Tax=Mycena alexandri TaxID=1745969 RepID=A0AAD6SLA6_9AGAR|nr:hypothetical protein C8F04DRAFT_1188125 [Mycena alexandri]